MKAFMTVCALMAASAYADSQAFYYNGFNPMVRPYSGLGYLTNGGLSYGMIPAYNLPYYRFHKREAEADLPYEVRSKMATSPLSRQEYKIQVDSMGKGQSYQHVERHQQPADMMDMTSSRYSMMLDNRQRMMDMDRQRMDRDQQRMDIDRQMMMDNLDRQRMMDRDQQRMDMDKQRMMYNMDRQRMMDRDQQKMDMDRQRMDLNRERMIDNMDKQRMMVQRNMEMDQMRDQDRMDRKKPLRYQMEDKNQMIQTHRMMIKRETDPAFSYTVMSEHPSQQMISNLYSMQQPVMARKDMNARQMTMQQIHPDGAFSYVRQPVNFPTTSMLYNMLNRIRPTVAGVVRLAPWA